MNVILIKDLDEGTVDAVLISEHTTSNEVKEIITKVREKEDYQWEDFTDALPKDCRVYDAWGSLQENTIYY